jgi:hypothetical protein
MKGLVLFLGVLATGCCFAQEEKELETPFFKGEIVKNEILEVAKKRAELEVVLSVYPNPSYGSICIEGYEGSVVTIHSAAGTYVGTWKITEDKKLTIFDLPSGSFVCIIDDGQMQTIKRIVVL